MADPREELYDVLMNYKSPQIYRAFQKYQEQAPPVAFDREYRYPIYAPGMGRGVEGLYIPRMNENLAEANRLGPAVVFNAAIPQGQQSIRYSPEKGEVLDQLAAPSGLNSTLGHERVHHIQAQEPRSFENFEAKLLDSITTPPWKDSGDEAFGAYSKIRGNMYGNSRKEAQAHLLANTLTPEVFEPDADLSFMSRPAGSFTKKKRNALDPDMLDKLQTLLYNELSPRAQKTMKSRLRK